MAYEMKDNSGSLFKNEKREKDTHAHARGSALIDGVEYWVDAWTNTAQNGSKYQSLKFKRKDAQPAGNSGGWQAPAPDNDPPF
jgi:hypothetical protein